MTCHGNELDAIIAFQTLDLMGPTSNMCIPCIVDGSNDNLMIFIWFPITATEIMGDNPNLTSETVSCASNINIPKLPLCETNSYIN